MDYIVILCNVGNIENAKVIAVTLAKEKLAACVNIIPKVISFYEWKNEIIEDEELTLLIKTKAKLFEKVKTRILELHTYETPEIISFDIKNGHKDYLEWIDGETL